MIDGLLESRRGSGAPAEVLAVILHGWGGSPAKMKDVVAATREALDTKGGVDIFLPALSYRRYLHSARAAAIVADLLNLLDEITARPRHYQHIILIGHSLGAVIAKRLFLVAAGTPHDFVCEEPLRSQPPRSWARYVDRIVTIGAFSRGWQISERMSWLYSILFNVVGLIGHLSPRAWEPTIFDIRLGAPFIVQTRLQWLAYRRGHQNPMADRSQAREAGRDLRSEVLDPVVSNPIVVQLIGTRDDLVSPYDEVDLAVDASEANGRKHERRYYFVELKQTDHDEAKIFSRTPKDPDGRIGAARRKRFIKALLGTPEDLDNIAVDPELLSDQVPKADGRVRNVVFVMHGIRDDGFWTHRIAERVREAAAAAVAFRSWTPTYGYFAMAPFLLPWIRRQKVEWFMDQYVSAKAQYANAEFDYVGHSNGTYLAARALQDYPAARFRHVFFAGSVVRRDYNWDALIGTGRVGKMLNVRASTDWVVALFPKSVEWWRKLDLGGGGFDGFAQAGSRPEIAEVCRFARGAHSAAIVETQWCKIARFIIDGVVPDVATDPDYVDKRREWLVVLSDARIGLPLVLLVLGIGIPLLILQPLILHLLPCRLSTWVHISHPCQNVDAAKAMWRLALFVSYALLVKFVANRL